MAIVTEPTTRGDEVASFRFTSWVSWKSIFAGLIAAIAVGVVLALLGMALGFTVFDPMSGDPLAGVGLTFGLWTLICGIVSLVVGGYVGGLSAGRYGGTHGFLVWCAVLIAGVFSTSLAAGMAAQGVGNLLGAASSVAAHIADEAGSLAKLGINTIREESPSNRNEPRVMAILRDTGVKELQPSAFMGQLQAMRSDLDSTLHRSDAGQLRNGHQHIFTASEGKTRHPPECSYQSERGDSGSDAQSEHQRRTGRHPAE